MRTLGDQAKAFRLAQGWSTSKMGKTLKTSRQNIESLESSGNRIPKYIGDLAHLMGVTVDEMLSEAGLVTRPAPKVERWPFGRVSLSRVTKLTPIDLAYVEGRLEEAVRDCEKPKDAVVPAAPTPQPQSLPSTPAAVPGATPTHGLKRKRPMPKKRK